MKKIEIDKDKDQYILYIYPSTPSQIVFFSNNYPVKPQAKILSLKATSNSLKEALPVSAEFFEIVETTTNKQNKNTHKALLVCKEDDYVLLDKLPTILPPSKIINLFKKYLFNATYDYIKEYGDIIEAKNPIEFFKMRDSLDDIIDGNLRKKVKKSNDNNDTSVPTVNAYIFSNNINDATNLNPQCKLLTLRCHTYDIKKYLPLRIEQLNWINSNTCIIIADDYDALKSFKEQLAPHDIVMEYRKFMASQIIYKYKIMKNRSYKLKELNKLLKDIQNLILQDFVSINEGR